MESRKYNTIDAIEKAMNELPNIADAVARAIEISEIQKSLHEANIRLNIEEAALQNFINVLHADKQLQQYLPTLLNKTNLITHKKLVHELIEQDVSLRDKLIVAAEKESQDAQELHEILQNANVEITREMIIDIVSNTRIFELIQKFPRLKDQAKKLNEADEAADTVKVIAAFRAIASMKIDEVELQQAKAISSALTPPIADAGILATSVGDIEKAMNEYPTIADANVRLEKIERLKARLEAFGDTRLGIDPVTLNTFISALQTDEQLRDYLPTLLPTLLNNTYLIMEEKLVYKFIGQDVKLHKQLIEAAQRLKDIKDKKDLKNILQNEADILHVLNETSFLKLIQQFPENEHVKKIQDEFKKFTQTELNDVRQNHINNIIKEFVALRDGELIGELPEELPEAENIENMLSVLTHPIFSQGTLTTSEGTDIPTSDLKISILGQGGFGVVFRCEYVSENPKAEVIKGMHKTESEGKQPRYWIGLKGLVSGQEDDDEFKSEGVTINELRKEYRKANGPDANPSFNLGETASINVPGKPKPTPVILTQIESWKVNKAGEPVCDPASSYLEKERLMQDGLPFVTGRGIKIGKILRDVQTGLREMHKLNFIHADLALRNVFMSTSLTEDGEILSTSAKIADFGQALRILNARGEASEPPNRKIPTRWAGPERVNQTYDPQIITIKSDYYSFRMLMMEIFAIELLETFEVVQNGDQNPVQLALHVKQQGAKKSLEEFDNRVKAIIEEKIALGGDKAAQLDSPTLRQNMDILISSFDGYFTSPVEGESKDEIDENEKKLLDEASKKYFIQLLNANIEIWNNSEKQPADIRNLLKAIKSLTPHLDGIKLKPDAEESVYKVCENLAKYSLNKIAGNEAEIAALFSQDKLQIHARTFQWNLFSSNFLVFDASLNSSLMSKLQGFSQQITTLHSSYEKAYGKALDFKAKDDIELQTLKSMQTFDNDLYLKHFTTLTEQLVAFSKSTNDKNAKENVDRLVKAVENSQTLITTHTVLWDQFKEKRELESAMLAEPITVNLKKDYAEYNELLKVANGKKFNRIDFARALFLHQKIHESVKDLEQLKFPVAPEYLTFKDPKNTAMKKTWERLGQKKKYKLLWKEYRDYLDPHSRSKLPISTDLTQLKQLTDAMNKISQSDKPASNGNVSKQLAKKFNEDQLAWLTGASPDEIAANEINQALLEIKKLHTTLNKNQKNPLSIKTLFARAVLNGENVSDDALKLAGNSKEIKDILKLADKYDSFIQDQSTRVIPPFDDETELSAFISARVNDIRNTAKQLIANEHKLFSELKAHDFLTGSMDEKLKDINKFSANVKNYVAWDIVNRLTPNERLLQLEFWILVADKCLTNSDIHSINMAKNILAAIESDAVQTLKKTNQGISSEVRKKLANLQKSLSTEGNNKELRRTMAKNPDAIPVLSVYEKDFEDKKGIKGKFNADADVYQLHQKVKKNFKMVQGKPLPDPDDSYLQRITSFKKTHKEILARAKSHSERFPFTKSPNIPDISRALTIGLREPALFVRPVEEKLPSSVKLFVFPKEDQYFLNALNTLPDALATLPHQLTEKKPASSSEAVALDDPMMTEALAQYNADHAAQALGQKDLSYYPAYAVSVFENKFDKHSEKLFSDEPALNKVIAAFYLMTKDDGAYFKTDDRQNKIAMAKALIDELDFNDLNTIIALHSTILHNKNHIPEEIQTYMEKQKMIEVATKFETYPTQLELAAQLSKSHADIELFGEKIGNKTGATKSGSEGGLKNIRYFAPDPSDPKGTMVVQNRIAVVKQDSDDKGVSNGKVIGEYVTGELMNEAISNAASAVFFTQTEGVSSPSATGKANYIVSPFYDDFREFYTEFGLSKRSPLMEITKTDYREKLREALLQFDAEGNIVVDNDGAVCRFEGFDEIVVASLLFGDWDFHTGNFGIIPGIDPTKDGRLVKIDHGEGTHNLSNIVRIHERRLVGFEVDNHFRYLPRELKISPRFANELLRQAGLPFQARIQRIIDSLSLKYGPMPLTEYAKYIGMEPKYVQALQYRLNERKDDPAALDLIKTEILNDIRTFLEFKISSRQQSLKQLASEIYLSLMLTEKNQEGKFTISDIGGERKVSFETHFVDNPLFFLKGGFHFRSEEHATDILGVRYKASVRAELTELVNRKLLDSSGKIFNELFEDPNNPKAKAADPRAFEYLLLNKELMKAIKEHPNADVKERILGVIDPGYDKLLTKISDQLYQVNQQQFIAAKNRMDATGLVDISTNIKQRVITDVLSEQSDAHRTAVLERWIAIMTKSFAKRDFNAVLAIYEALLVSPEIPKLTTNFQSLSDNGKANLDVLKTLFADEKTMLNRDKVADFMVHELSQSARGKKEPCIPAMAFVNEAIQKDKNRDMKQPLHINVLDNRHHTHNYIYLYTRSSAQKLSKKPVLPAIKTYIAQEELTGKPQMAMSNQFAPTELERSAKKHQSEVETYVKDNIIEPPQQKPKPEVVMSAKKENAKERPLALENLSQQEQVKEILKALNQVLADLKKLEEKPGEVSLGKRHAHVSITNGVGLFDNTNKPKPETNKPEPVIPSVNKGPSTTVGS